MLWTRNNAAGIWDSRVELPHSLAAVAAAGDKAPIAADGAQAAPAANGTAEAAPAPAEQPAANGGGSASTGGRPPLHPSSAGGSPAGAAALAGGKASGGGGMPRLRSVQSIPQHDDVEKKQPGVTAQPDDARLLGSPVFEGGAAAGAGGVVAAVGAPESDAAALWRTLLEEQLRCAGGLWRGPGVVQETASAGRQACPRALLTSSPAACRPPSAPTPCCSCGLALVDVEIPLVALADGVHSRSFSGAAWAGARAGAWPGGSAPAVTQRPLATATLALVLLAPQAAA